MTKIYIDPSQTKGPLNRFWSDTFGGGYAALALRADYQQHLRDVKAIIGCDYLRIHGIFHDNLGVYQEAPDGTPIYNWHYVDKVYDFLMSIDIKPFVEFGFMPEGLASGSQQHFWWKANVTPPKDMQRWHDLVYAFVSHLVQRYGIDEVRTWRFEVWNEPNLPQFWGGTQTEYFEMYAASAHAVKAVDEQLIVGGPAIASGFEVDWVTHFIDYCKTNDVPFDFISAHCYETGEAYQEGRKMRRLALPDRIMQLVRAVEKRIREVKADVPLYYTEWNSCTGLFDIIHDHEFQAPFILNTLKRVQGRVDAFAYWAHSDVFEEQGVFSSAFGNGFGIVSSHGLRKAGFNAFAMLSQLGDIELETGDQPVFAAQTENEIQIILWHELPFKTLEQPDRFDYDPTLIRRFDVSIVLSLGDYTLTRYQIDKTHSNPYFYWKEMGSPQYPTVAQIDDLRMHSHLEQIEQSTVMSDGILRLPIDVPACGAVLLKLGAL